jgi:hypothetical protein
MANRSTFNRRLPRELKRLADLSVSPVGTHNKELRQLHKGAGPEGYERSLRKLFIDAHATAKRFKTQKLDKALAIEPATDVVAATTEVSAT